MLDSETMKSERALRELILRNLRKEIHAGTKPSIDFIWKILEDAYNSEMKYDVSDMKGKVLAFANNSSNNSIYCVKTVMAMKFASEDAEKQAEPAPKDDRLVFYDVEVFPNLFVVCWKYQGSDTVVKMINPKPAAIEELIRLQLVGFNNRRYDNHILYARIMGYTNSDLYQLSQRIINGDPSGMFGDAVESEAGHGAWVSGCVAFSRSASEAKVRPATRSMLPPAAPAVPPRSPAVGLRAGCRGRSSCCAAAASTPAATGSVAAAAEASAFSCCTASMPFPAI